MKEYSIGSNSIREYFDYIKEKYGEDKLALLLSDKPLKTDGDVPFLSVIVRTVGNRQEALREALLCLASQTDSDFEVLLMGHNLSAEAEKAVTETVEDFSGIMPSPIRLIKVNGGTRTTPLNEGFKNARGVYTSVFDDDDLLFDNWVETFHKLYEENPGKMLHAYSVSQDWKRITCQNRDSAASISAPGNNYCCDFEMVKQLSENRCPFMSVAFPRYLFNELGLRFDEKLTTTEDWDFLMRASFISGVATSSEVTSIYRHWKNATNSSTLHNKETWDDNQKYIQNRFKEYTIPLSITELSPYLRTSRQTVECSAFKHAELFIDNGKSGFAGNKTAPLSYDIEGETFRITADTESFGEIRRVRFDPDDYGMLSLKNVTVTVNCADGSTVGTRVLMLRSNNVNIGKRTVFLDDDPQICIHFKKPTACSTVVITCAPEKIIPFKIMLGAVIKHGLLNIPRKGIRFAYRVLSKLIRR